MLPLQSDRTLRYHITRPIHFPSQTRLDKMIECQASFSFLKHFYWILKETESTPSHMQPPQVVHWRCQHHRFSASLSAQHLQAWLTQNIVFPHPTLKHFAPHSLSTSPKFSRSINDLNSIFYPAHTAGYFLFSNL